MTTTLRSPTTTLTPRYPDTMLVSEARDLYFSDNDLGDGGYDETWVKVKIGRIPLVFPNTASRKVAVRAHDMHHLVTGCNAIWNEGELDVSAFELRSGGPGWFLLGWPLILTGFVGGLLLRPRGMFRQFVASRGAKNLIGTVVDERIYSLTVGELRAKIGLKQDVGPATPADVVSFAACSALALSFVLAHVALAAGLLALAWKLLA